MMIIKEKLTGSLLIDETARRIHAGKLSLSFDEIEDAAWISGVDLLLGKKLINDSRSGYLLVLNTATSLLQPGGKRIGNKQNGLCLILKNAQDCEKVMAALGYGHHTGAGDTDGNHEGADDTDKKYEAPFDISIRECIVEAKRGFSDYVRGGTAGSRPYGRPGLVTPIIIPEPDFSGRRIRIHYVGTNGYHQESEWFSAHPDDWFEIDAADVSAFQFHAYETGCKVSALWQNHKIEKDPEAKGLWSVYLDSIEGDYCSGLRWLQAFNNKSLTGAQKKTIASSAEPTAKSKSSVHQPLKRGGQIETTKATGQEKPVEAAGQEKTIEATGQKRYPGTEGTFAPLADPEKFKYLGALTVLREGGIITEEEYSKIKSRLDG